MFYIPPCYSETICYYIYALPSNVGSKFKVTFIIVDICFPIIRSLLGSNSYYFMIISTKGLTLRAKRDPEGQF